MIEIKSLSDQQILTKINNTKQHLQELEDEQKRRVIVLFTEKDGYYITDYDVGLYCI